MKQENRKAFVGFTLLCDKAYYLPIAAKNKKMFLKPSTLLKIFAMAENVKKILANHRLPTSLRSDEAGRRQRSLKQRKQYSFSTLPKFKTESVCFLTQLTYTKRHQVKHTIICARYEVRFVSTAVVIHTVYT